MSAKAQISVVMPVYNGSAYLAQELSSILPQLGDADELLILDDGSQDGSRELVSAYAEKWPQIRLLEEGHVGVVQNFARGIERARGKYIFLADQDDLWMPDKVQKVCEALEGESGPALVLHNAAFVDAAGQELGQTLFRWRKVRTGFGRNWLKNSYMGCCMAFNRELKPYVLPFPKRIPMHDQWIGLLAEHYGRVTLLEECLLRYRRHGHNATGEEHKGLAQMMSWRWTLLFQYMKRILGGKA